MEKYASFGWLDYIFSHCEKIYPQSAHFSIAFLKSYGTITLA